MGAFVGVRHSKLMHSYVPPAPRNLMNSAAYLRRAMPGEATPVVRELMEACGWRDLIPAGASVAVKPNLCTERPEQIHTANTSAEVLRAVCEVLRERTDRVTIV